MRSPLPNPKPAGGRAALLVTALLASLALGPARARDPRPVVLPCLPTVCPPVISAPALPTKASIDFFVLVPPKAVLWIDNHKTETPGERRRFRTPPVLVGRTHQYTLRARCGYQEVVKPIQLRHADPTPMFDLRGEFRKPEVVRNMPLEATLQPGGSSQEVHRLRNWSFPRGTRRLGWLATHPRYRPDLDRFCFRPPAGRPAGPEALEVRRGDTFLYAEGVLDLVPLEGVSAIHFDNRKQFVFVEVRALGKRNLTEFTGNTAYRDINKVTIRGIRDLGAGGAITETHHGGLPEGIASLQFPDWQPAPPPPDGRPAVVVCQDGTGAPRPHRVSDLLPLYRTADGAEQLSGHLHFSRTAPIPVGQVLSLELQAIDRADGRPGRQDIYTWQIQSDGGTDPIRFTDQVGLAGKPAHFLGFIGRTRFGYQFFPLGVFRFAQLGER